MVTPNKSITPYNYEAVIKEQIERYISIIKDEVTLEVNEELYEVQSNSFHPVPTNKYRKSDEEGYDLNNLYIGSASLPSFTIMDREKFCKTIYPKFSSLDLEKFQTPLKEEDQFIDVLYDQFNINYQDIKDAYKKEIKSSLIKSIVNQKSVDRILCQQNRPYKAYNFRNNSCEPTLDIEKDRTSFYFAANAYDENKSALFRISPHADLAQGLCPNDKVVYIDEIVRKELLLSAQNLRKNFKEKDVNEDGILNKADVFLLMKPFEVADNTPIKTADQVVSIGLSLYLLGQPTTFKEITTTQDSNLDQILNTGDDVNLDGIKNVQDVIFWTEFKKWREDRYYGKAEPSVDGTLFTSSLNDLLFYHVSKNGVDFFNQVDAKLSTNSYDEFGINKSKGDLIKEETNVEIVERFPLGNQTTESLEANNLEVVYQFLQRDYNIYGSVEKQSNTTFLYNEKQQTWESQTFRIENGLSVPSIILKDSDHTLLFLDAAPIDEVVITRNVTQWLENKQPTDKVKVDLTTTTTSTPYYKYGSSAYAVIIDNKTGLGICFNSSNLTILTFFRSKDILYQRTAGELDMNPNYKKEARVLLQKYRFILKTPPLNKIANGLAGFNTGMLIDPNSVANALQKSNDAEQLVTTYGVNKIIEKIDILKSNLEQLEAYIKIDPLNSQNKFELSLILEDIQSLEKIPLLPSIQEALKKGTEDLKKMTFNLGQTIDSYQTISKRIAEAYTLMTQMSQDEGNSEEDFKTNVSHVHNLLKFIKETEVTNEIVHENLLQLNQELCEAVKGYFQKRISERDKTWLEYSKSCTQQIRNIKKSGDRKELNTHLAEAKASYEKQRAADLLTYEVLASEFTTELY